MNIDYKIEKEAQKNKRKVKTKATFRENSENEKAKKERKGDEKLMRRVRKEIIFGGGVVA